MTIAEQVFHVLNMSSAAVEGDLTGKANIRNAALRLFAERGHDAVTMREIAVAAGVSPALVVHHFGSKDGLRAALAVVAGALVLVGFAGFHRRDVPRA